METFICELRKKYETTTLGQTNTAEPEYRDKSITFFPVQKSVTGVVTALLRLIGTMAHWH